MDAPRSSRAVPDAGGEPALSIALPKTDRLLAAILERFMEVGHELAFGPRELMAEDKSGRMRAMLVRNHDLPIYVDHGIAGLGICGSDVIGEADGRFLRLHRFDFRGGMFCLAAARGSTLQRILADGSELTIATSYPRFSRGYFSRRGIPTQIIRLTGSVELAPVLGLAPCIVDIVETGATLAAQGLEVIERMEPTAVYLIANPAYYKLRFRAVDRLVSRLAAR